MYQRTLSSKSGVTLAEVLVGMTIAGMLSLLILAAYNLDALYHSRLKGADLLQEFEKPYRFIFSDPMKVKAYASTTGDATLAHCLATPCDKNCSNVRDWQPINWGAIERISYTVKNKSFEDGSHFVPLNSEKCYPLPPPKPDYEGPPLYKAGCALQSFAEWRSGPQKTVEIRIRSAIAGTHLQHTLYHYAGLPELESGLNVKCPEATGVYCKSQGAYLLSVDFKNNQAVCGDPATEVNY